MELLSFLPLIIIMGVFLYLSSRRQRKAVQATIDLQDSLQVGDRVNTTSGLQGTIAAISDDTVDLEIAPGVVTRWIKLAIRDRIESDDVTESADDAPASASEFTESDRLAKD